MAEVIRTDFSNEHGEITRLIIIHGPDDQDAPVLGVPPGFGGPAPDTIGKDTGVLAVPPGLDHADANPPIKP